VDWSCGGSVFAHIRYPRQLAIKREIITDAFMRIGRMPTPAMLSVMESEIDGYRMRARLHVQNGRVGFFREGSHVLCDPAPTRQLLPSTVAVLHALEDTIRGLPRAGLAEIEVSENSRADQRAIHFDLTADADPSRLGSLPAIAGVTGMSCGALGSHRSLVLSGSPLVIDTVSVPAASGPVVVTMVRHVRSFFQGNRFLLPNLAAAVIDAVPAGCVLDLYAGVGLFAAALAVRGGGEVMAVEGDRSAAEDLKRNADGAGGTMMVRHQGVETFLAGARTVRADAVIVDPPRTGLSKAAITGVIALKAPRVVYVSCDVATFARDARLLVEAGYRFMSLQAFDMFPNTAHVESVGVFER
jgi:23S rRNA (uracil1939-C5)-methyltransferase